MTTAAVAKEVARVDTARDRQEDAKQDRETSDSARSKRRTPALLLGLIAAALALAAAHHFYSAGREFTDDAQVESHVAPLSARVAGQVLRVHVEDDQAVRAGDVMIELDQADFQARVSLARAELAAAEAATQGARAARQLAEKAVPAHHVEAQGGLLSARFALRAAEASLTQMDADLAAARARRVLAEQNFVRYEGLLASGATTTAEHQARRAQFDTAQAEVAQAESKLAAARAQIESSRGGVTLAEGRASAADTKHEQLEAARAAAALADARVEQAAAALKLAELNLGYTAVRAPIDGVVSRRSVEPGQMVGPDRPLLAIVSKQAPWVVANFKEDQVGELRLGQRATVEIDAYGGREFHGRVQSLSAGTGSRFALIPPDNASGNFVKVTQRIPVRIQLDALGTAELRAGMSAEVTIDTHDGGGRP